MCKLCEVISDFFKKVWEFLWESDDDYVYYQPGSSTEDESTIETPVTDIEDTSIVDDTEEVIEDEPVEEVIELVDVVLEREPNKFAVLVGINIYEEPGNDLSGCVNDVDSMYNLLTQQFGFNSDNIKILTDSQATKQNIINHLNWLADLSIPGDELVFHYSGHGSQVIDNDWDEEDFLDEILCPYDLDWDDPLTDDIIHDIFKNVDPDAYLTMVCDACHSGTMSREFSRVEGVPNSSRKSMRAPIDRATLIEGKKVVKNKMGRSNDNADTQNHVLFSGCTDEQTSSDAWLNGRWQGAMTWSLMQAINNRTENLDWTRIQKDVLNILAEWEFEQTPELSGKQELIYNRPIFGGKK